MAANMKLGKRALSRVTKTRRRFNPMEYNETLVSSMSEQYVSSLEAIRVHVISTWGPESHSPSWAGCCFTVLRANMDDLGHITDEVITFSEIMRKHGLQNKEEVVGWISKQCELPLSNLAVLPTINMRHGSVEEFSFGTRVESNQPVQEVSVIRVEEENMQMLRDFRLSAEIVAEALADEINEYKEKIRETEESLAQSLEKQKKMVGHVKLLSSWLTSEREDFKKAVSRLENEIAELKKSNEAQTDEIKKLEQLHAKLIKENDRHVNLLDNFTDNFKAMRQQLREKDILLGKRCNLCKIGEANEEQPRYALMSVLIEKHSKALSKRCSK